MLEAFVLPETVECLEDMAQFPLDGFPLFP